MPRTLHKWTGPELARLQAAADAGMTQREASDALGMSPKTIAYATQYYRVLFRRAQRQPRPVAVWDRKQQAWQ